MVFWFLFLLFFSFLILGVPGVILVMIFFAVIGLASNKSTK